MIDTAKLLEALDIEGEGEVDEATAVALILETIQGLKRRTQKAEGELSAARSSTLATEMGTLRGTVSRLEEVIKTLGPTEAQKDFQHRCDVAYARVPR